MAEKRPEWTEKYAGLVTWNLDAPVDGESVVKAATATADWLEFVQSIYHSVAQNFPREMRTTCGAGMCPDYRAYAERLRVSLAAPDSADRMEVAMKALVETTRAMYPDRVDEIVRIIVERDMARALHPERS